jgi:opacity protein-like surface antigen
MKFIKSLLLVIILISFSNLNAQKTVVNNEIGVFLGPVFMQTDYGESGEFSSATNNVGVELSIAYIMDFTDSRYNSKTFAWLSDHMKAGIELSFSKVNLEHNNAPVEEGSAASIAQFKGMTGDVKLFNIGTFGEWYFMSLTRSTSKIQPYLLTGLSYSSAKSSINFDSGIPYNLEDFANDDKNNALSFSYGLGARYKLNDLDIVVEGRFKSFLSDEIEGLEPQGPGNKNNDSSVSFKIGTIFHLN